MKTRFLSLGLVVIALVVGAGYYVNSAGNAVIETARYAEPTKRYVHDVIGNNAMMGSLIITLSNGKEITHKLPQDLVFEDTAPRIADVTGDGEPDVIVVESSVTKGARVAVWGADGRIAASSHIGQASRWMAPAGIADFDGDGLNDIAVVDRPHLNRALRVFDVRGDKLTEWINAKPLTNHRIGDAIISGGVRVCDGGKPELVLAEALWRNIAIVSFPEGREKLQATAGQPITGPESFEKALNCLE
jgi:hypothetical protein